jgi:hypothetical protein
LGESLHVLALVFRVFDRIEGGDRSAQGVVLRNSIAAVEGVGDPHLVEVGVAGEGDQTGVLVLNPEATGANGSAGLDHRNLDQRPLEASRLIKPVGIEVVAVNSLYEAIAEEAERGAESSGVLIGKAGDAQGLLDKWRERPKLNQRPVLVTRRFDKDAEYSIPGPQFPGLAGAAGPPVLVACATTHIVVDGPKSIIGCFALVEDEFVVFKRAERNRLSRALIYGGALGANPLKESSVSWFKSWVGAAVMVWDPATELGSVVRHTNPPTTKVIAIISFSDFI